MTKYVLITGATHGIGLATSLALIKEGFHVLAGVISQEESKDLEEKASNKDLLTLIPFDVTKDDEVERAKKQLQSITNELHALICNAGVATGGPIEYVSMESSQEILNVNYFGVVRCIQAFIQPIKQGKGRIIITSSILGLIPAPFIAHYSASKAALESLGKSLRQELKKWHIPVVMINPGHIDTRIMRLSENPTIMKYANSHSEKGYQDYTEFYDRLTKGLGHKLLTPHSADEAAQVFVKAVVAKHPRYRYMVGADTKFAYFLYRLIMPFFKLIEVIAKL